MTELHWPRDTTFVDFQADLKFAGSGTYEVPDELVDYYKSRGWEDPPEDHEGEAAEADTASDPHHDGPKRPDVEGGDSGN